MTPAGQTRGVGPRTLITRKSTGLGYSCASMLIASGASVVLPGRRPDLLKQFPEDCHLIAGADLSSEEALKSIVSAVKPGGVPDGVVPAAPQLGGPGMVSYAASKAAREAAVRSPAMELASQGIRVNAVSPGVVEMPMSAKFMSLFCCRKAPAGLREQR
jgi:NAD(P)-dependent dehydrogenase (short-subunit alcohol dehydrogenase family)